MNRIALLLIGFALFAWWYVEAEDFAPTKLAGTYVLRYDGRTQSLVLHPDQTFDEVEETSTANTHAHGTWRVFSSTGHIAFSPNFLGGRQEWRGQEDHEVYGTAKNYLRLPLLTFRDIKAYKKLFL